MENAHAIHVQDLHRHFGEIRTVQGVSFDVAQGEIMSLLGPNGAGKSTTISMFSCLLEPSGGDARVMGHSIRHETMAVRTAIGAVPQEMALYEDLSARENLAFWGEMYGLRGALLRQRTDDVLDMLKRTLLLILFSAMGLSCQRRALAEMEGIKSMPSQPEQQQGPATQRN
jgi:linearmycin/streptolysin S transport system ATP-binding protein